MTRHAVGFSVANRGLGSKKGQKTNRPSSGRLSKHEIGLREKTARWQRCRQHPCRSTDRGVRGCCSCCIVAARRV